MVFYFPKYKFERFHSTFSSSSPIFISLRAAKIASPNFSTDNYPVPSESFSVKISLAFVALESNFAINAENSF
jgi:hypothetical protein